MRTGARAPSSASVAPLSVSPLLIAWVFFGVQLPFFQRRLAFNLEWGIEGISLFVAALLLLNPEVFFFIDFPLKLSDFVFVATVLPGFTFAAAESSGVPAFLGPAELSVDDDLVPVDLPSVGSSDRVFRASFVSELNESVASRLSRLRVLDDVDALDRAKDVEFLVEPVLGRLVVESAHEYGLVRVTLDLLVRVWMPYIKFAI